MKRIIAGKRYDTDTAEEVTSRQEGYGGDFAFYTEALYRTPKGAWFLAGEGGPRSHYAEQSADGRQSYGGSAIRPMTGPEARQWLEALGAKDEALQALEKHFSADIEDA